MLKPGPYRYSSFPGEEPIEIEVVKVDGQLMARFPAQDGDDGADLPVDDLAGRFEPVDGGPTIEHVDHGDTADMLERMLAQAESGDLKSVAFRYQDPDGTWHDVTAGFDSEEEAAAALAKLHRAKGHLN